MKEYPLTEDDIAQIGPRVARGEPCIIPIRRDIELAGGVLATNCLTWGHPNCYRIVVEDGNYYGRPIEDCAMTVEFLEFNEVIDYDEVPLPTAE